MGFAALPATTGAKVAARATDGPSSAGRRADAGWYPYSGFWAVSERAACRCADGSARRAQPVFTALFMAAHGEKARRTWLGLFIGFAGVAFVLEPKLASTGAGGSLTVLTVGAALFSVISITAGALIQKKVSATDIRTAASMQNIGGVLVRSSH